jgi:hypothetical protein
MARGRARKPKFDLGQIVELPTRDIKPAPVNAKVYKPVDPEDQELQALAGSICQFGLQEPLVITVDNVVVSGHRRLVACRLAGLKTVPCRRIGLRSWDPEFLQTLVAFNHQRIKSLDERVREAVVAADPTEAHRALREHRKKQAEVSAETIKIVGHKRRARITDAKQPLLDAILRIIEDLKGFWPLSDRQIHYQLLSDPPLIHASKPESRYANNLESYKSCTEIVTRARLEGLIAWEAIDDPTRPVTLWSVHRDQSLFFREQLDGFLKGYARDLMQSQPNHVEIVAEKLTVETIVQDVAMDYGIPVTVGRGYSSTPPRWKMAQRYQASGKEKLILMVVSDFDPEGEDICHSFARSMRDDFGVRAIEPIKVALTHEQVLELGLPPNFKAKEKSSRFRRFVEKYGDDVFELEAVPPETLQRIIRETIDSVIDVEAFNAEIEREKKDAAHLDATRKTVHEALRDIT